MKIRSKRIWFALLIMVLFTAGAIWPVAARETQPEAAGPGLMLRLKYATFDPLQGEPEMPVALHTHAHRGAGEGAYIVQFQGPVQGTWTDQVRALGGRLMGYLPDFAYLVWMDGAAREQVATLDAVRWVGLYQPAYKLSPNLDRTKPLYRVVLFEGADLGAVSARLATLNTPTRQVTGEQFALLLPEGGIDQVATWPEVLWIENRPLYTVSNDVATGIMGATTAWGNGYTGTGQKVTVADTGIDTGVDVAGEVDMHADFNDRFKTTPVSASELKSYPVDISWTGCAANVGADDGAADIVSGHGTHVLGSVLGNGARSGGMIKGTAYQATPTFQAVEQYTTWTGSCAAQYSPGYYITGIPLDIKTLFQEAYNWGSRIHSNSWGAPVGGEYTADSESVDQFVWDHPEMLIVFSAGNAGTDKSPSYGYVDTDSLDAPGTAKNALTVGASDNLRSSGGYNPGGACVSWYDCWPLDFPFNPTRDDKLSDDTGELAAFSSRGPADDGRRKPDIVAPGTNILSTRSSVASGSGWGLYTLNPYYLFMGGTSMATPLVAGTAALVREYYVDGGHLTPSAALIKATLINSAVDIPGYGNTSQEAGLPIPNNHEGWGRVEVGAATSGDRQFVDGLSVGTGQTWSDTFDIGSSATSFKVTLVWSDFPASVPAGGLVNDLDLVVTAPGGAVYRGNYFSGGWSVAGGTADRTNNVESVYIQSPAAGPWTVQVGGYNVAEPGGSPQQPFALVATGFFGPPPPPPIADFSAIPTSGERPLEVSFTDLSTGDVTGWAWDFGDTIGASQEQHPTYTYQVAGDYEVSLTVTGPGGESTETKTDYIHVLEPPSLAVNHTTGAPGSYFIFTGQNFAPDDAATISVNGVTLAPTVPTGGLGGLEFALHTQLTASTGGYFVTASTGSSATAYFQLVTGAEQWSDLGTDPTIEVPDSIAPSGSVYLPLVLRYYAPPVPDDPIVNGDFESGPDVGWDEDSLHLLPIVLDSGFYVTPHSGDWLAWLGGYSYELAWIEQPVTIPVGRSYLHYWHWRESSTSNCNLDEASLRVDGALVVTYDLCVSTNTGRWVEGVVDLSAYAGQTVPLQFRAETSEPASSWYLDDISFEVSAVTADAAAPTVPDAGLPPARKTKSASDQP